MKHTAVWLGVGMALGIAVGVIGAQVLPTAQELPGRPAALPGEQPAPASKARRPVVFIPGNVTPAASTYGPLLEVLKAEVQPILKELELYAADTPPPDYTVEVEVEGLRRAADAAGLKRCHLVGYSWGGTIALAFAMKYPERVKSLTLTDPYSAINDGSPEVTVYWAEMDRVMALPPEERVRAFLRVLMRPGVEPPPRPPGPPPPWMATRPAGLIAWNRARKAYTLDRERVRRLRQPIYLARAGLSPPAYERGVLALASLLPDVTVEVYEARSHIDAPHRAEPERFARGLRELWRRAEAD